jgi:undecaprenyl-diphosphatase
MVNMDIFQAVFLGVVQGVTEVLPISSSGHLVLVPWLWGFEDPGLSFDVALHIGTLLAIIIYFRKDWIDIIKGFFSGLKNKKFKSAEEKLPLFIVLATIPGVLAGYFLNHMAEDLFRSPYLIAFMLVFFGYILILAERMDSQKNKIKDLTAKRSLITGVAQAIAIIPGVSRSGVTISAGMFQGFTREAAARFSFLISAPIIFGAGVFEMRKMPLTDFSSEIFWAGLLSSVFASFLTVRFLMKFVKSHKLNIFAYYRFALAGFILLIYILGT